MAEEIPPVSVAQSRRRWLAGAGMLAGGQVVALVVGGLASIVLARALGPAGFGTYSVLAVVVSLATLVATFGLDTHLITELRDQATDPRPYRVAFRLCAELSIALCAAGIVVVLILAHGDTRTAGLIAVLELMLTPLLLARAVLISRMRQGRVAAAGVVNRLALLAGVGLIAALHSSPALVWMMTVSVVAVAAEALILGVMVRPPVGAFRRLRERRRQLLAVCWPLVASGMAVVAYGRVDQLLLAAFRGRAEVGTYAVAVSLATVLSVISAIVYATTLPGIVEACRSRHEATIHPAVHDMALLMFVPGCLGVAVLAGAGGLITNVVFGSAYSHDHAVIAVLVFAEIWIFAGTCVAAVLIAVDRRRTLLWGTVSGLIVDLVLCLLLLAPFGAIAAAWASFFSYAAAALVAGLLVPEVRHLARPLVAVAAKASAAAAVGAVIGAAMPYLVSAVLASSIAYLVLMGLLFRGEVARVWRHIPRRRVLVDV
jgi:O-antigen/teichoic acid export membrane protein